MIADLGYHLIHSKPSAELIGHLSQLSWDIVLVDIRLHIKQFPDRAENSADFHLAWSAPTHFIFSIESYVCFGSLHNIKFCTNRLCVIGFGRIYTPQSANSALRFCNNKRTGYFTKWHSPNTISNNLYPLPIQFHRSG